ncbi:Polyketide cyclase / dehydrase and lipid transport [Micromonospora matsumotoense]|uniref:Polyketide cyclase / dehydrase and lipid transport n=1 Tax=Micromonospora matsumotoense TaxID=121616 RepID=A0A1C5AN32_9ACTN|nr:SRPBCC family protein [Micromonospora matsumotoense]SCF46620.1 Polyketide cyclase / dehydrase and lipid transport [Micromonospora matsumotoense]
MTVIPTSWPGIKRMLAASLAMTTTLGVLATSAHASARSSDADSGAPRCAGESVDPNAKIRYRTEAVIDAPLRTIWKLQTDVARWPSWQQPVLTSRRLDSGPLRAGSSFQWTTPVQETHLNPATTLVVTSTVHQLQRQTCVRWSGPAVGEGLRIDEGVHVWTFTEVGGRVLVRTEETWRGRQVEADVGFATAALGAGLEVWLRDLKATAERDCDRHRR